MGTPDRVAHPRRRTRPDATGSGGLAQAPPMPGFWQAASVPMAARSAPGENAAPMNPVPTATLLVSCRDRTGLVAALSDFVFRHNGNILDADQHAERESGVF